MKQVTVLLDNENKNAYLLQNLGTTWVQGGLCMMPTQAMLDKCRFFTFNTFGLMTENNKLDEYLKTRDGIICLMNYTSVNDKLLNRMKHIVDLCPNSPIVFLIGSFDNKIGNFNINVFDHLVNNDNRKAFKLYKYDQDDIGIKWFHDKLLETEKKELTDKYTSVTIPIKEMVTDVF